LSQPKIDNLKQREKIEHNKVNMVSNVKATSGSAPYIGEVEEIG
jgi:hypothetical protein